MNQAQLDSTKEAAAQVVVSYTNGYLDMRLSGKPEERDTFEHCLRLHYLYGILDEARIVGTDIYCGSKKITGASIEGIYHKIWHYNGILSADLSAYSDITADDGDTGSTAPSETIVTATDHYRAGSVSVVAGSNVISFSSALASANYQVDIRVVFADGTEQRNVVPSSQFSTGFVVSDVLQSGTLHYTAILNL